MARKLKTYQTSLGFFDMAVAAPSMKAALEAWGADSNLFHQGAARQSDEPDVIAATMAAPGVVLKRPVGSSGRFREHADLPTNLDGDGKRTQVRPRQHGDRKQHRRAKIGSDSKADRRAAVAFEKEQARRRRQMAKEEAARRKDRDRRQRAVDKAQSALNAARRKHEDIASKIQADLEAVEKRSQAELDRWEKERTRLEAALKRARV
jgi:hypothetical protein